MSCNSPTEVGEKDGIIPKILLTRSYNADNSSITCRTSVKIMDIENNYIRITHGAIYIDDHKMSAPGLFGTEYVYSGEILAGSVYTIRIVKSDSSECFLWIETPPAELNALDCPSTCIRDQSLDISWYNRDFRYPQKVDIAYCNADNAYITGSVLNIEYPYKGSFTIGHKYVKYTDYSESIAPEMKITLHSRTSGILDDTFEYGGSIEADFSIYKTVEVK